MMNYTNREYLEMAVYEAWKDVYGSKPSYAMVRGMSDAKLSAMLDRLSDEIAEECARDRAHNAEIEAAMHDPDAFVVLDHTWEDMEDYVESSVRCGDYSMFSVYRPEPVPANHAIATAFRRA